MDSKALGWIGLILALSLSTFGMNWCFVFIVCLLIFIVGFISLLYVHQGDIDRLYRICAGNPLTQTSVSDGGLKRVVRNVSSPKKVQKSDHRVTGSELIDSSLQEILFYIIRDYVMPWYSLISTNRDFPQTAVRMTAQNLAINVSNRVKEVDWIPYLTTRLVDDAASHLRLFKQARAKMKQERPKSPKNSPRKDAKGSPKRAHRRNKSETDVSWYFGSRNLERKDSDRSGGNVKFSVNEKHGKNLSFEDHFFDLEFQMENNVICRDLLCTSGKHEREFLSELVELLLYIFLPDDDFISKPLRFILREVFANCVVLPLFTMISDPDYINQAIMWICLRDNSLPSDIFLTTLRLTDNCDELKYTKEIVSKEIQLLRSRDSGGESDLSIKQQLSSLQYVIKLIDNRLLKLDNFENFDSPMDYLQLDTVKKIDLPLDIILKNNVALSYFIDFVSSHTGQHYLFFYLNIDAWRTTVKEQLQNLHHKPKGTSESSNSIYENIRTTALGIHDQYLKDRSESKIDVDQMLVHKLFFKIKNPTEVPSENWFDDIRSTIYERLETKDEFLPAFKRSKAYLKLLQELDLLSQTTVEEDTISLNSLDPLDDLEDSRSSTSPSEKPLHESVSAKSLTTMSKDNFLKVESVEKNMKHVRSLSDVTELRQSERNDIFQSSGDISEEIQSVQSNNFLNTKEKFLQIQNSMNTGTAIIKKIDRPDEMKTKLDYTLSVRFVETGIVCDKGKTFGIYAIQVTRQFGSESMEQWHIYRRYSDFYDLHSKIKDKFPDLSKIAFPGKKTFHNMERAVLERRMRMLGSYMQELCQSHVINSHHGLRDLLMTFLEQGDYDRATSGGPISHTIDTIVNPLKSGMKTIKNMPEQLINTVDEVVEGLNKVFHSKSAKTQEASKVGASLDIESDDNIPLRIMLLMMDEVFDLKSRNQWLRRRIVTLLRQILRTMFGDIVNRRILDYVSVMTSPKNVAHYLHIFKQSFWPNGVKAETKPQRDEGTKYRTRIAAKIALLTCLSDELKHIIGSETMRKGLLTVFELFQRPTLNRRLIYVLLEGILCNMFPEKNLPEIFQKLHSKSPRFQEKQKSHSSR